MVPQRIHNGCRKGDAPATMGSLRLFSCTTMHGQVAQGGSHLQGRVSDINILPLQGKQLTDAHACCESNYAEYLDACANRSLQ